PDGIDSWRSSRVAPATKAAQSTATTARIQLRRLAAALMRPFYHELVGEEDRQRRVQDEVTGHAAKDHLAQPALRVGALDDQVGTARHRRVDDGLAGRARARLDVLTGHLEAMARQR